MNKDNKNKELKEEEWCEYSGMPSPLAYMNYTTMKDDDDEDDEEILDNSKEESIISDKDNLGK